MEPGAAIAAAAAATAAAPEVASGVVTILGIVLSTDQFIAATHVAAILAIGVAQVLVVLRGINAMERSGQRRTDEHDRRHRQTMDDQQKRHDEAMAAMDKRHEESMAAQRASMTALEELIRRTAPPPAGG